MLKSSSFDFPICFLFFFYGFLCESVCVILWKIYIIYIRQYIYTCFVSISMYNYLQCVVSKCHFLIISVHVVIIDNAVSVILQGNHIRVMIPWKILSYYSMTTSEELYRSIKKNLIDVTEDRFSSWRDNRKRRSN